MSNVEGFTNTQKIKEEAALWLLSIEQNSPLSKKESQALEEWVETSDVHKAVIFRMAKTWNNMDILAAMRGTPEPSKHSGWKAKLGTIILDIFFNPNSQPLKVGVWAKTSAFSIFILAGLFFANIWMSGKVNDQSSVYVTSVGEYKKQSLKDGSTVWLNSNSKVKVSYSENFRRIALIQGEAHFEVAKDASRPFEVYSENRLVRAIGTAFSVHKLENRVDVIVSEGTVELAIVNNMLVLQPDDLIDTAGESFSDNSSDIELLNKTAKVTQYLGKLSSGESMAIEMPSSAKLDGNTNQIIKLGKDEVGRKLSWLDGKLMFAGESLQEVIAEISRHTSVKIDVPEPELRKLRIGGHFKVGETDKLFYILESGFGIEVNKIDDNHVELLSKKTKKEL